MVGGERAKTVLLDAITVEGARALSKKWIGHAVSLQGPGTDERVVGSIQGCAAQGLVFFTRPGLF